VLLRHIVCDSESQAKKLLARSKAGEDFSALARAESKDEATRDKGGFLGWIEKGQLEWPALEEAAFSAKQGEVAGPVKTARGWHLLRAEGFKDAEQKSFQEVKDKVMQAIYMKRLNDRIESWVKDLKQKTYVETMP
jgi:peptidyl-prolyl cis-trans isomerase C